LLAFLNPKIAVFFLALFAPWSARASGLGERLGMGLMAGLIDAGWYALVGAAAGGAALGLALERHRRRLDLCFGGLLVVVAAVGGALALRALAAGA
jgi:threonine/homoserine/homoserine lactone efflux protein